MFKDYPGITGSFTKEQAEGAIPNGTRIRKANSEREDMTPTGTPGIVLGSLNAEELLPRESRNLGIKFMYFIAWDDRPVAVAVVDRKIEQEQ